MINEYIAATRKILPPNGSDRVKTIAERCVPIFRKFNIDPEVLIIRTRNTSMEYVGIDDRDYIICDTEMVDTVAYLNAIYYQISPRETSIQQLIHNYVVNQLNCVSVDEDDKIFRKKVTRFSRRTKKQRSMLELLTPVITGIDTVTFLKIAVVPTVYALCHEAAHAASARNSRLLEYWRGRAALMMEWFAGVFAKNLSENLERNSDDSSEMPYLGFLPNHTEESRRAVVFSTLLKSSHLAEEISCDVLSLDITLRFALANGLKLAEAVECIFVSHRNLVELYLMSRHLYHAAPPGKGMSLSNDELYWRAMRLEICKADLGARAASLVATLNGDQELILSRKQDSERFTRRATQFIDRIKIHSKRYETCITHEILKYRLDKKFIFR